MRSVIRRHIARCSLILFTTVIAMVAAVSPQSAHGQHAEGTGGTAAHAGHGHEGHDSESADSRDLVEQLRELRIALERLEAALEQNHTATTSASSSHDGSTEHAGHGHGGHDGDGHEGGGHDSAADGASGDKGMTGMGRMGGQGMGMEMMSGMSGQGMSGMGMMGGRGMRMMGRLRGDEGDDMQMPSALPGFPGASHIYHIGATGFFLDHPQHITLTTEQQTALNQIREQTTLEQADYDRAIEDAEQELWVLTASDQPDAEEIRANVDKIAELQAEQRMAFIVAVGEAAGRLTDEQRHVLTGHPSGADVSPAETAQ